MAGFFGFFDYAKPGPGIPKDLPPKPRIVVFFEVLQRKFWNMVRLNLMHTIFNIPALAFMFVGVQFLFPAELAGDGVADLSLRLIVGLCFVCFPILCFGPAQAGSTFVLRNYAREEHAFIWGDYKEHALKNAKEGLLICAIDFAVFLVLSIAANFYSQMMAENLWAAAALGVSYLASLLFAMMHIYIYPMLVTFKITVRQLYKNALIFSAIKFLPNLGILLLCAAIMLATFIVPFLGAALFALITNALINFILNFYAYPTLKKYMIDRVEGDGGALAGASAGQPDPPIPPAGQAGGTYPSGSEGGKGENGAEAGEAPDAIPALALEPEYPAPPGSATEVWPPSAAR